MSRRLLRRRRTPKYLNPFAYGASISSCLSLDSGPSAGHRPMDGRFLLLVLGFAPCPVLLFAREKALSVSVSYRPRSDARYEGSRQPFVSIPPSVLEIRLVNQSINQSQSCQSLHMLAIIAQQVTRTRAKSFSLTRPLPSVGHGSARHQ
eukprot:scaffold19922_cov120-Isochrysis_galbana.AAC.6